MTNILGVHQTDFANNLAKTDGDIADLTAEVVTATLADAGIGADAVESIHVGNAFGQLYTGQGHLGAMPATVEPALWGVPRCGTRPLCVVVDGRVGRHGRDRSRALRLCAGARSRAGEDDAGWPGRCGADGGGVGWA